MLPPSVPDWQIYAGDDQSIRLDFTDSNDAPIDLSGVTGWSAQVRRAPYSNDFVSLTIDTSAVAGGTVFLSLDAATTAEMQSGAWDLQGVQDGQTKTFCRGNICVTKDVTRA